MIDLEQRRSGIGGSDVAPILGQGKWKSALRVYLEKRGLVDQEAETERMQMGKYEEAPILSWYEDTKGVTLHRGVFVRSAKHPWMIGNLDALILRDGPQPIVEAKNVSFRLMGEWGEEGTDEIPFDALYQVHHYMAVCPWAPFVEVVALIGGAWPPRIYRVERNDEFYAKVIPVLERFWRSVEAGTPPEVQVSHSDAVETLRALYPPRPEKITRRLPKMIDIKGKAYSTDALIRMQKAAADTESDAKRTKEVLGAILRRIMGDATVMIGEDGSKIERQYVKASERSASVVAAHDRLKVTVGKPADDGEVALIDGPALLQLTGK